MSEETDRLTIATVHLKMIIRDTLFRSDGITLMTPEQSIKLSHDVFEAIVHESAIWALEEIIKANLQK